MIPDFSYLIALSFSLFLASQTGGSPSAPSLSDILQARLAKAKGGGAANVSSARSPFCCFRKSNLRTPIMVQASGSLQSCLCLVLVSLQ